MIVYHGGLIEIRRPDVDHSKQFLDFGKGFYVTTYSEQTKEWAIRKSVRFKSYKPTVNVYELNEDFSGRNVLTFRDPEDEVAWLKFVCDCRNGKEEYLMYDLIVGAVANDDVFKTVDFYRRGIWSQRRALRELRYYKKNNQIAFIKQQALDELLKFQTSYVIGLER